MRLADAKLAPALCAPEYAHAAPPAPGGAIEVAPGVLWLRMGLPFALNHVNCWLLRDTLGWTAVDCGLGDEATRALWETHFASTLAGRPIVRVIATHAHPDHLGLAGWLARRWSCPLWMTQGEYLWSHALANRTGGYGGAFTREFFVSHGLEPERAAAAILRTDAYRSEVPELCTAYRRIFDGERIAVGERQWRVIMGYGHSSEHAALYCESHALLISGDMLLPAITTNVSVWPSEPDADPVRLYLDSLERLAALPGETLVLPSHGLPFRGARERVAALRAHHAGRLEDLAAALDAPRTAAQVLPALFRRPLDTHQLFFAMGEAIAHLNHLYYAGAVERIARSDGSLAFMRSAPYALSS